MQSSYPMKVEVGGRLRDESQTQRWLSLSERLEHPKTQQNLPIVVKLLQNLALFTLDLAYNMAA